MWNKRDVILKAFSEIGLASYAFDLTPAELDEAMQKLDSIVAYWTSLGIVFDPIYPQPATINAGDLDDLTNAPDFANAAMSLELAKALAPSYGKAISPATNRRASIEFNNLLRAYSSLVSMSLEGAVGGAGHKSPFHPFLGSN